MPFAICLMQRRALYFMASLRSILLSLYKAQFRGLLIPSWWRLGLCIWIMTAMIWQLLAPGAQAGGYWWMDLMFVQRFIDPGRWTDWYSAQNLCLHWRTRPVSSSWNQAICSIAPSFPPLYVSISLIYNHSLYLYTIPSFHSFILSLKRIIK